MNENEMHLLRWCWSYKGFCSNLKNTSLKRIINNLTNNKKQNLEEIKSDFNLILEYKSNFEYNIRYFSQLIAQIDINNFSSKINEIIPHCSKMKELIEKLEPLKDRMHIRDLEYEIKLFYQIAEQLDKAREFNPKKLYLKKKPLGWFLGINLEK